MGYFSQKKKHQRENNFLFATALLTGFLAFLLAFPPVWPAAGRFAADYLFQIYLLIILILIYALWLGRWSFAAYFAVGLLIIFTYMSSYANLFFNIRVDDRHHMQLSYQSNDKLDVSGRGLVLLRSGHLNLDNNLQAPFASYEKNLQVFTFIKVDFPQGNPQQLRQAFERLRTFITMQDDPVIVYGNFGVPAWSPDFKKFLLLTDLKVKNRLWLTGKGGRYNPFAVPQFYILAFENVGVNSLQSQKAPKSSAPVITAELGYY